MTRRLIVPLAIALLALSAVLPACRKDGKFRHGRHLGATGGACEPCHGGEKGAPRGAVASDCAACHKEAGALPPEGAARYAVEARKGERPRGYADVIFSHEPHAGAGIACAACHPPRRLDAGKAGYPAMEECAACHAKEGVARECATCHREIRKTVAPPSHAADWEIRHGAVSRSERESCAYCHAERSCSDCHATRRPSSHVGGWDKSAHGLRATEDRASCAACHEAGYCNRCHGVPPPSHALAGSRFGGHRAAARFNPRSCAVCHDRSFCATCH